MPAPPPQFPAQVQNLAGTSPSPTEIDLTWSVASLAASYRITRNGVMLPNVVTGTSFADTGLIQNTTYTYTVISVNAVGSGIPSAPINVTTQNSVTPPQQGKLRFNPGPYIYLDRNASVATKIARMNYFGTHSSIIQGFQDIIFFAQLENPNVPGDYSGNWDASGNSGFQYYDKMLAACVANRPSKPFHMMWQMSTYGFAGTNQSSTRFPSSFVPAYWSSSAYGDNSNVEATGFWGAIWQNTTTMTTKYGANVAHFVRWTDSRVMDLIINMVTAYGKRYDNLNPAASAVNALLIEMMSWIGESTIPTYTGYNDADAITQYKRYFQACRQWWPTAQLRFWGNYLSNSANFKPILDMAAASYFAVGGPDCVNEGPPFQTGGTSSVNTRPFPANKAYRGINPVTNAVDPNYINYVGKLAWVSEFEPDEEMPRSGAVGPAQLGSNNWTDYIAQANMQGANYTTWFDNGYGGNNDKRFTTNPIGVHPDALDWVHSCYSGGVNVNGAQANITVTNTNNYPSLYPK